MSSSQVIDWVGNGKIYNDLLPNPYPFPAQPSGLAAVLATDNNAGNQNIENLLQIETTNVVQQDAIGGHLTIGGTPANPGVGGTLRIQGGTDKGSLLVGDGTDTKELVCPTTTTTSTTSTIYNWLSLANGQSRQFQVSDGSLYQLGYSITIVYSGTDSITGTITAVVGNLVTITIVSFTSAVYTPAPLITTTPPDPATATSGGGDPVFIFNPAVCTPATIPANSFLLTGLCYLYGAPPVVGSSNITLTAIAIGAVNPTTSIFSIPQYENPPVSTSAFSWGADGCYLPLGSPELGAGTGGAQIAFAFPTGGSFIDQNFTGSVSGYTLAYTPNGVITINSKLVLTADNSKPLGVFWGVDAQGVGTITSVSAGTNISVTGSLSAPVVNLATPTTSNIQLGVGTELIATNGPITMSVDATGFNDIYSSGGVVNQEDIAVTSTNVQQTLSATQVSDYINSAVLTCDTNFVSDARTSQILTAGLEKTATANFTCSTAGSLPIAGVGCGVSAPTTSPFPDITASVSMTTDTNNPIFSLTQSAPFATSYSTILDKDGILQNNSSGNGFRCRSAQDIYLEPTNGLPNPQTGVIRIPNGNSINMSVDSYTTSYRKDGMSVNDIFTPSSYACSSELTATGGNSQMFLGSSNIGVSSHTLRAEVPLVGDATIAHETLSGTTRNLTISTQGALGLTTTGGGIGLTATGGVNINAGTIGGNTAPVVISNLGVGGQSNPTLTLNNSNATGSVAMEVYKNKPTAGSSGDVLFTQSVNGKDGANNKQEYTRITHTIRANTSGVEEGSIEMGAFADGAYSTFIQINGNDTPSGEVNILRPLDFIGGSDANSTIKTSGTGSVNLNLDASTSAGAGGIVLKTKNSTGSIAISGDQITTITAGANTGRHLRIFLPNGAGVLTPYKINLFADT